MTVGRHTIAVVLACSLSVGCDRGLGEDTAGQSCRVVATGAGEIFEEVSFAVSDAVPTVVVVDWSTTDASHGWVQYGAAGSLERATPASTDLELHHRAQLLGLRASTEYALSVVTDVNGERVCTEPQTVRTGALPAGLPDVTLSTPATAAAAGGYTVAALRGTSSAFAVILDEEGVPCWASEQAAGPFRARLSLDRQAVAVNFESEAADQPGVIRRIPLDGSEVIDLVADGIHTDFVEIGDQRYAALGWTVAEYDQGTRRILGETIVEISSEGVEEVWNIFDHLEPDLDQTYPTGWYEDEQGLAELWSQLNGIFYDTGDDAYYLTSRSLDAVLKIDRQTGALLWTLANSWGDFAIEGDGSGLFCHPHSVESIDGGLLVFDAEHEASGRCSAAVEVQIDTASWTAREVASYATEDCVVVTYLGNAQQLWNGNRLLVLSTAGQIDEITPDGELAWRVNVPYGHHFGLSERVESLY